MVQPMGLKASMIACRRFNFDDLKQHRHPEKRKALVSAVDYNA
jgi:hypothetical protein